MAHKTRVKVIAQKNEDIERLLGRFKKAVAKSGILRILKDKRHYVKPSALRHKKKTERKKK